MKICDVPYKDLQIGDRVISCVGKHGYIAGLFPIGSPSPLGGITRDSDYGDEILFLWIANPSTWSLAGHDKLQIEYVGKADWPAS